MQDQFIKSVESLFIYYKSLGEKTFQQLSDEQLAWKSSEDNNSIFMIVNHLWGNMMSRWTDFLTTDGEKEWRNREQEFEEVIKSRSAMMEKWEEGWSTLFSALETVSKDNFNQTVYIRNEGHSIMEAVHRQLAHYSYHIGQIVYIGKLSRGDEWESLSIAKGGSKSYNADKFAKEKRNIHFTKEI